MIQITERKPPTPPEPEIDLTGTGFNLQSQLNLLRETIETRGGPEVAAEQVKRDLEGLWYEYIRKSPVLPINVSIKDGRLFCPGYEAFLSDVTSENEREGTVKQAIFDLERKLSTADEGDLHLIVSPPGWAGPGISHPVTQIYCYEMKGGEIKGKTLVMEKMTIDKLESLRRAHPDMFGQHTGSYSSEEERIMSFTSQVVQIDDSDTFDVLNLIESHLGYDVASHRQALEKLPEIDHEAKIAIEELVDFIKTSTDFSDKGIKKIAAQIGKTVIDLKGLYMWGRKPESKSEYMVATQAFAEDEGCNGGGLYIKSPTGDRRFDYEFDIDAHCVVTNCISPMRGRKQQVGPCYICEACSIGIKEGTLTPIYSDDFKNVIDNAKEEAKQVDVFFASCVLIFISLFN